MSQDFPYCRHRREPRTRHVHHCRSPKLAGLKLVTPEVCSVCPYVDHHYPPEGEPCGDIRPSMPVGQLVELLAGPARPWPAGWGDWDVTHQAHLHAAEQFLACLPQYPADRYQGRGVVIAGGGTAYFPSLYVVVRALRHVGWTLPIQVWYLGRDHEMPSKYRSVLERYGVDCVDADEVRTRYPCRILNGWELKAYAVLHSPFEEVLSLDADCYPVRDPALLFDVPEYRETGAVFWPDLRDGPPLDWRPFGLPPSERVSIESGQFLVNKRLCWEPLQLAWWFNDHSDWSYLHGYGDKHTFEVAWARCARNYTMFQQDVEWSVHSFKHVGPDGRLLFVHRCRDKFRFGAPSYLSSQTFAVNCFHAGLPLEEACFTWRRELADELGIRVAAHVNDAEMEVHQMKNTFPSICAFMYTCTERREVWEGTMNRWRTTDWGSDPVVIVDTGTGTPSLERHLATARRMVERALETDADFFLMLENDLLFNVHLRHNLLSWPPLRDGWLWMGSLYNPSLTPAGEVTEPWRQRYLCTAPNGYYGAQAVILSRVAATTALREWEGPGLGFDVKLAAIAQRHSPGIVVHTPSLVQHVPVPSLWGGSSHRAVNFDPFYRA